MRLNTNATCQKPMYMYIYTYMYRYIYMYVYVHIIPGTPNSTMILIPRIAIGPSFPRADERIPYDQLRADLAVLQVVRRIFWPVPFPLCFRAMSTKSCKY